MGEDRRDGRSVSRRLVCRLLFQNHIDKSENLEEKDMKEEITDEDIAWADHQVAQYTEQYPDYDRFAKIIEKILKSVVNKYAPDSIVQTRPKSIASFAGKIWRKRQESIDPVHQFTDLCGARVIANNRDGIKAVCDYIESHFEIDHNNSVTIEQRLKPSEFGYRSILNWISAFSPKSFSGIVSSIA